MDPLLDFDAYANGHWKQTHHIPADRTRWSTFDVLSRKVERQLIQLCEQDKGIIGAIFAKTLTPIHAISSTVLAMLDAIEALSDMNAFIRLSWVYHTRNVQTFFGIGVTTDPADSRRNIPLLHQSGLGLPGKHYYTEADTCQRYQTYIEDICRLYGRKVVSEPILTFEKRLAVLHKDHETLRNVDQEKRLTAHDLPDFLQLLDLDLHLVVTRNIEFFQALPGILRSTPLETLKEYLYYKVASAYGMYGTKPIRDTNYAFYRVYLMGQKQHRSKKATALKTVEHFLPVHLQKLYLRHCFQRSTGVACRKMVHQIIGALRTAIQRSSWMSTETKQASLEKLSKLKICVGRPTKWPSTAGQWADLNWETADLSTLYASRSMWAYQTHVIQEFYRPVDRNLWAMRAYEVNACYDLNMNQMIIPAGIIQKPFFGHTKVSRNFGALGSVIGHELTHGFDDQGRKFNPDGNLVPWWNSSDIKEYEHRAAKVRNYYASLSFMGMPVNGKLTLGENLADIGGLTLSLRALERANGALKPADYRAFFKAYAVLWRLLITKKAAKKSNLSNPHAPDKFRVNGVVTHMVEFYRAYGHQLNPQQIKKLHSYSIW